MHIDDLIYVSKNQLDKDFCEHVIEKFKKDDNKHQGLIGRGVDTEIKQSTDLLITGNPNWEEEDNVFFKSIGNNLDYYVKWLPKPYGDFVLNFPPEDTGYQIQETKPGGFYKWHHDQLETRRLTFIWYLNDITEAGYTEFNCGLKIQPEMGKMVIFPGLWPWIHRGVSPTSETKYICTGWIRERNADK
mgnify:FL=1